MSSVSVLIQEIQTEEKPQTADIELASWWLPGDATSEKSLIRVLSKMAEHVLKPDVVPHDDMYEQMSIPLAGNTSGSKVKGRQKRKMNKSKKKKKPRDAVVQLKMFD